MTNANPWEAGARRVKVAKLCRIAPAPGTPDEVSVIADFFAALSVPDRARFASNAGVKAPSPKTWAAFVEELRARRPLLTPVEPIEDEAATGPARLDAAEGDGYDARMLRAFREMAAGAR